MCVTISDIEVLVRAVTVKERCADSHLHDILAQAFQEIYCACHSRIFSEGYQSIAITVTDLFIVNQAYVLLENGVKSGHVLQLCLNIIFLTLMVCEKYRKVLSGINF